MISLGFKPKDGYGVIFMTHGSESNTLELIL